MNFDEESESILDEERRQLCREKIELSKAVDKFEATYDLFLYVFCFIFSVLDIIIFNSNILIPVQILIGIL